MNAIRAGKTGRICSVPLLLSFPEHRKAKARMGPPDCVQEICGRLKKS